MTRLRLCSLAGLLLAAHSAARGQLAPPDSAPATGEVIVRFRDGVPPGRQQQILAMLGERSARIGELPGTALVRPPRWDYSRFARAACACSEVLYAEPNYEARILGWDPEATPFAWNLFARGAASARAISQFGTQAALAWPYTRGRGVIVALLDTGIAFESAGLYWQAPDLAGARFVPGWDFINEDAHPNDDNGHGTHVAGILAAGLDSLIPGVAPEVTLMPVKVMRADGGGNYYDIARGLRYAADHGAQVINLSVGGANSAPALEEAARYATAKGCVLVAAAGNDGGPEVDYPARFPQCIAVGATLFDGNRATYSNRGSRLDLVAPGGDPLHDLNGDGRPDGIFALTFNHLDPYNPYGSFQYVPSAGTSMAAPQVAGVAALVRAANPALTTAQVRAALLTTALHLGARRRNNNYGYGLVDALAAVAYARALLPARPYDNPVPGGLLSGWSAPSGPGY